MASRPLGYVIRWMAETCAAIGAAIGKGKSSARCNTHITALLWFELVLYERVTLSVARLRSCGLPSLAALFARPDDYATSKRARFSVRQRDGWG